MVQEAHKAGVGNPLKASACGRPVAGDTCGGGRMSDIETKLQQIAGIITQIDDPKVPRNIRPGSKTAREKWLLNKAKDMDVRIAMTQNKLEELFEDPNMPPEFGTLILQINTALEQILREV